MMVVTAGASRINSLHRANMVSAAFDVLQPSIALMLSTRAMTWCIDVRYSWTTARDGTPSGVITASEYLCGASIAKGHDL